MPSRSKKQHNFMAAIANNPEFAAEAGVPRSVGAKFMAKDKKVKKYQRGKMVDNDSTESRRSEMARNIANTKMMEGMDKDYVKGKDISDRALAAYKREDRAEGDRLTALLTGDEYERIRKAGIKDKELVDMYGGDAMRARSFATDPGVKVKKVKKKKKKMGGGVIKYNRGGSVRGAGCARQGVRKAKMVRM